MSLVKVQGNVSGTGVFTVAAPNSNTDRTLTLPDSTGTVVSTGDTATVTPAMLSQKLTSGTAVSASGTSVNFTGIPSWVKRITVMFGGVSTSGTSNIQIQLGDSGGIENSGYSGAAFDTTTAAYSSAGALITSQNIATATFNGLITVANLTSNTWSMSGTICSTASGYLATSGNSKSLSDVLTQIRITTVNGTDTFDAGTINIMYEG